MPTLPVARRNVQRRSEQTGNAPRNTVPASAASRCRKPRRRFGSDNTHIWSAPHCRGKIAVYMKDKLQSYIRHLFEGLQALVP